MTAYMQSALYAMIAIAHPSVCHTGGSLKNSKLGSCNFHHRVAQSL